MAMIQRLLARVAVIAAFACSALPISAQNVIHLRIDTVTAAPGSAVDVRVLYTFTSTHTHDIHDFLARFLFDTTQSHLNVDLSKGLFPFIMNGAAPFPLFDTVWSYSGLLVIGNQEIDLTDSVLFTIRMTLDSNADTAWIRWDRSRPVMQTSDEGVDSVLQTDGWIRSSRPPGSVMSTSSAPAIGMYPNPAREEVTINVPSNTQAENMEVFDEAGRLAFSGPLVRGVWHIPQAFVTGAYQIVLFDAGHQPQCIGMLIVAPR